MKASELIALLQKFPPFLNKEIQAEIRLKGDTIPCTIVATQYDLRTQKIILTITPNN